MNVQIKIIIILAFHSGPVGVFLESVLLVIIQIILHLNCMVFSLKSYNEFMIIYLIYMCVCQCFCVWTEEAVRQESKKIFYYSALI